MRSNHFSYHTSSGKMAAYSSATKESDSLGVIHTDSYWINKKKHIVLIIETRQMISNDIEVLLKDNNLTIEAPLIWSSDLPFKMNKVGLVNRIDIENGLSIIGFYSTWLKRGYKYTYISSETIDSNLIKVTLKYEALDNKDSN